MNYQVNQQEITSVVFDATGVKTSYSDVIVIPANTVVTGIVYEEVDKCDASKAISLHAKTANADFNGFTTGSTDPVCGYVAAKSDTVNCTVTSGAEGETVTAAVPGVFFTKAGDVLQVKQADAALTKGKLRIGIVGFRTGTTETITSAGTNQAPVDPYTPPEKR